jgi:hypothetical protein
VILGILAAIVIPQLVGDPDSSVSTDVKEALVTELGSEWENTQPGDLIEFPDGKLFVVRKVSASEITFRPGYDHTRESVWLLDHLANAHSTRITKSDSDYTIKCRVFVYQLAGLPPEGRGSAPDS